MTDALSFDEALHMLSEALEDPGALVTIDELERELRTSPSAMLWRGKRSAVFLRVETADDGQRTLWAAPAAGDLAEILTHATGDVERVARAQGCAQILIQAGRDGWERALAPHGYERAAVVLRKVL